MIDDTQNMVQAIKIALDILKTLAILLAAGAIAVLAIYLGIKTQ